MKQPQIFEIEHFIKLISMLDEDDKRVATVMMEELAKRSIKHRIVNRDGNTIEVHFGCRPAK